MHCNATMIFKKLLQNRCSICVKRFLSVESNESARRKFKMQAWQIHSYGDLKELQFNLARIPHLTKPSEVLIKVEAASLNPIDSIMINGYGRNVLGMFRGYELEFPLTLGRDFSGEIIDKGHSVSDEFKIGDKVYGVVPLHQPGSHAEKVIVDESMICHRPKHLNHMEATSIPYAAMTAWSALFISADLALQPITDEKVLILGASGGVGTMAIQILKSQGAKVYATCNSAALSLVQSLGATSVFDYTSTNFSKDVASEGNYDIILDCCKYGLENIPNEWKYKKFVTLDAPLMVNTDKYGLINGLIASACDLIKPNIEKYSQGKSVRWGFFVPSKDGLQFIDSLVKTNHIKPVVQEVFKFKDILKAFERLNEGHLRGKIVIDMT